MIENIWSGWRSGYISNLSPKSPTSSAEGPSASPFRRILESGLADEETFIVHRGTLVFSIMNAHPYSVGHLLVLPYRQVANLEDLNPAESNELWSEVQEAVRILRAVLSPDGFNVGLNLGPAAGGSVNEHLHVHVVPRWFGDANFLVSTASVKSIPEALDVTSARVRSAWTLGDNVNGREDRT